MNTTTAAALTGGILVLSLCFDPALADGHECRSEGELSYICGMNSPEDLVTIPGTKWVVASGFAGAVPLYLVDSENKTWRNLYPGEEPVARQDMTTYGACPGSPDPNNMTGHGLNIRSKGDGLHSLYVVGHGEREAIEVFEMDTRGEDPAITWVGCVMTPEGMAANSVASLPDGSLIATIPLRNGVNINDIFNGAPSGAVYEWSPGDAGFSRIEGTEMPYANGVEVSDDGKEFYIASSGLVKVMAFTNTNPARLLRSTEMLSFIPDNLHWSGDGKLLTAGMELNDPVCGTVPLTAEFDFGVFMSCNRSFTAIAVDPDSMAVTTLASSPSQQQFSNATMAIEVGSELWIGTFAGDRVAVFPTDD